MPYFRALGLFNACFVVAKTPHRCALSYMLSHKICIKSAKVLKAM